MAKKKADYIDGLYEVASQIEDARGEAEAQEPAADGPEPSAEQQPSSTVEEATKPVDESSGADTAETSGPSAEPDNRGAVRTKTIRAVSKRTPYICIGTERLYVIRSQSGQVVGIDWRAMAPKLAKPITIQDRFYVMDNEIDDLLMPDLDPTQQSIYRFLYRNAYGWGRCVCAVSFESVQKGTGIKSRVTVQKAIDGLRELGCISVEYEKSPVTPRVYRVYLPCEMKAYEGRSKRSETIRSETIRSENDEVLVQKLNICVPKNERIENERMRSNEAYSCNADEPSNDGNASKNSTKNSTVKDSSRREALELLLSSRDFKVNPDKINAWATDESLGLDVIESYIEWVAGKVARGECKKAVPFLVSAIDGRWPIDEEAPYKREAAQAVSAADPKVEEDEDVKERIAAMSPEEQGALAQQALDLARDEWVYKRAKTQEARDGVVRGKMMEMIRATLRESAATRNKD